MAGKGMGERMKMVRELQQRRMMQSAGQLAKTKQGTGKRLTAEERRRSKKQREGDAAEERDKRDKGEGQNGQA